MRAMKNSVTQQLSFDKNSHVYMIGILGSGMSGLAGILCEKGVMVSGSDEVLSHKAAGLTKKGATIFEGAHPQKITSKIICVIASLAVPENHPEKLRAQELNIPIISYPEAVGVLTRKIRTISVCGTHGKTTTTSMIAKALLENSFDPTVLVGSDLHELKGANYHSGTQNLFVLESCEYKKAFLNYSPSIILLNNLDPDHLDYFKTYENYLSAFIEFCKKLPKDGYIYANIDDEDVHAVVQDMQKRGFPSYNIFTFSAQKYQTSDFYLNNVEVFHKGQKVGELDLSVPGAHNRSNALAAYSVCRTLGVTSDGIIRSLNTYTGAARRFEHIGTYKVGAKKVEVIDDYGHHPEEIKATLQAAREKYGASAHLCVVFQPHQYSRTRLLFNEFVESLSQADTVIIPNIYEARDSDEDKKAVSAQKLVDALTKTGIDAHWTEDDQKSEFKNTVEYIKTNGAAFSIVITMGAGDVWKVARALTK